MRANGLFGLTSRSAAFAGKPLMGGAIIFAVAFFAAFAASSVLAPVNTSDASDLITANVESQEYYVKISSSDVAMNLITTPAGAMTVVNSTVKTATNSPTGYKLYLGMSPLNASGTEKSSADKLKNGLYLDGDLSRTDGMVFTGAPGTGGTSGTLAALTDNTWGYAVDKNTTGVPTIWQSENHSTMSSATPTNDKFAAVPAVGSEELIQTTNTNNVPWDTDPDDIDFTDPSEYTEASIYYGIRGTNAKTSGAYSNTVAYTAVAQASPDVGSITFSPATYTRDATYESMVWDDQLTIYTTLYTNMEDLGTASVTLTGGPEGDEDLVCTNPTLAVANNLLNVTCTLPAAYAGTYTVNVHLDKFGQDYSDTYTYAATWDTISAMQEMTSTICAEPGNVSTSATTASSTMTAEQLRQSGGTVVPEKFLTDVRGGGGHITGSYGNYGYQEATTGKYRIRKLADGNCWMTENMDYPQQTTQVYHPYDTNVTADWSPTNNYITTAGATSTGTEDRTYYGNGSAGNRTVTTQDSQTQNIGTYYTWGAATAGQGATASGTVSTSICPKGWILPNGGNYTTDDSFGKLVYLYTGVTGDQTDVSYTNTLRSFPTSFVFSGFYYWGDGKLYNQGTYGYWWSSTADSSTDAYFLYMNSSGRVFPQRNGSKYYGFTVRCISAP